ncbi:MAG: hypothetical protein ABI229_09160 [Gemmatimonadaceae bacterium]
MRRRVGAETYRIRATITRFELCLPHTGSTPLGCQNETITRWVGWVLAAIIARLNAYLIFAALR